MLFAGLQGHAQSNVAARVSGHTDDPPRHCTFELIATGKIGRVRAAIAHWYAKTLRRTKHHVGTHFSRRGQQQQAKQVSRHAGQCLLDMQLLNQRAQVANLSVGIRVLQQRTKDLVPGEVVHRVDDQFEAETLRTRLNHGNGLRVAVFVDKKQVASGLGDTLGQGHGLGGSGGFVEQGGVGQLQTRQVDGQLLKIQQRFKAALSDLGLIRRVGGVPARVFQHVAHNHGRRESAVVAHADQAGPHLILLGVAFELGQRGVLVERGRQLQRPIEADGRRHSLLDQFRSAGHAERFEHSLLLPGIRAKVAPQEDIRVLQLAQGRQLGHDGALL